MIETCGRVQRERGDGEPAQGDVLTHSTLARWAVLADPPTAAPEQPALEPGTPGVGVGSSDLELLLHVPELHDAVGAPREDAGVVLLRLHAPCALRCALRRALRRDLRRTWHRPAHALHGLVARLRPHLGDHLLVLHRRHLQ